MRFSFCGYINVSRSKLIITLHFKLNRVIAGKLLHTGVGIDTVHKIPRPGVHRNIDADVIYACQSVQILSYSKKCHALCALRHQRALRQ